MIVEKFPDRSILIENKPYLYFGGTAYLGLPTQTEFLEKLTAALQKWGSFYGSSRSSNIKLSIFDTVETFFAQQIKSESAVVTSSGTLAGKLVLEYLSKTNAVFYHYPKTHPAILGAQSLPLFVENKLHPNLLNSKTEDIVVTADAILALEVEPTLFDFLENISKQKRITLLVDESHSLGLLGSNEIGLFESISNKYLHRKIMVSSLGKAFGISGGLVVSDYYFIKSIKKEPLFVSSSCANPAYLEAFLQSQDLIQSQQMRLQKNLDYLFEGLDLKSYLKYNKNYPVIYSEDDKLYNHLLDHQIIITNFKYPTYKSIMSRIVITANHKREDILNLKQALNSFKTKK